MGSTTTYYSRELSFLGDAKTSIKALVAGSNDAEVGSFCNLDDAAPAPLAALAVPDPFLYKAAAVACDPLLKFKAAWDSQTVTYTGRRSTLNIKRMLCGDRNTDDASFRSFGVIPLLLIIAFAVAIVWIAWSWFKRVTWVKSNKVPVKPKIETPQTLILIIALVVVLGLIVPIVWTFGIIARHESSQLDGSLRNDSGSPGGDDFKLYNNTAFGRIWQACNTGALRQVYNCSLGVDPNVGLEVNADISGATCIGVQPSRVRASDRAALLNGLFALANTNLADFDAVGILKGINRGITVLHSYLEPHAQNVPQLSGKDAQAIVVNDIVKAILQSPAFIAADADDRSVKQVLFINAMSGDLVPRTTQVLLLHWPQVNPDMYINDVDQVLSKYYDVNASDYYDSFLRDYVLEVLRSAMVSVRSSMVSQTEYVTVTQFMKVTWPQLQPSMSSIRMVVRGLRNDIDRYIDSFIPVKQPGDPMASDLLIFLIYFLFVRNVDLMKTAATKETTQEAWFARMDVAKYVIGSVTLTAFVFTILMVVKRKAKARADHNKGALFYNTQKLRSAMKQLDDLVKSTRPDPLFFYNYSKSVIESYRTCNFIAKGSSVPFPTVEFILLLVFLLLSILGLVFITNVADPFQKIKEISDLMGLRHRLRLLSSYIPPELDAELDGKVLCVDEEAPDVMRIMSFAFVVMLCVLNIVLIISFNKGTREYQAALDILSADACI